MKRLSFPLTRRAVGRLALLAIVLLAKGCGGAPSADDRAAPAANGEKSPPLEKVTLLLNWYPEAEHGGYYAALASGIYARAGLDVTILPGGPDTPMIPQVATGRAMFGVANADNILFGRAEEAPVVAIMAPLQVSPRCLLVHEKSGIRRFEDLKNITLAMSASAAFAKYLRGRVPLENVQIVPYSGNVAQFLLRQDYAQQGYVFSEPIVARRAGGDVHVLMLSDLGFNPYTSLLFTREDLARQRPELARRMTTASIQGWEEYVRDPRTANQVIHRLNPEMDEEILAEGAAALRPLALDSAAEQHGIGRMSRDRWRRLAEQLVESEQLAEGKVDPDKAFTLEFLPPAR